MSDDYYYVFSGTSLFTEELTNHEGDIDIGKDYMIKIPKNDKTMVKIKDLLKEKESQNKLDALDVIDGMESKK